jgi:glycogen debranching enzyme
VPILQKAANVQIVSTSTRDEPIDSLLTKEWLLTNERGSYASSTIVGCNTRGYHGLLIGSAAPPANRVLALANCLEMLIINAKVFELSTFEFSDKFAPAGFSYIKQFRQDAGVHFDYELDGFKLTKSVYLLRDSDTVCVGYFFTSLIEPAEFVLRPFVALRDFHALQKSHAPLSSTWLGDSLMVQNSEVGVFLSCPNTNFEEGPQWWFNFIYRQDRERGQNFTEDLWTPGFFKCRIERPTQIVLWARLAVAGTPALSPSNGATDPNAAEPLAVAGTATHRDPAERLAVAGTATHPKLNTDIAAVREALAGHQGRIITAAKATDPKFKILCLAADQFITSRERPPKTDDTGQMANRKSQIALDYGRETRDERRTTILAGFPWFAAWGRDAFVALPGLLLSTGRFEDAKSVLCTFAQAADQGMIPNRFDDYSDTAHFNSVDASLWFINAAFAYLDVTGDSKTFTQQLLPTIRSIVQSYQDGTRFGIHADVDGLITAGSRDTQLTWMDAKYDGVAFTPRYGKAVEINALWYNSLRGLAYFYAGRNSENAYHYQAMAEKVAWSFCSLFWNEAAGYLNDCVLPDGTADASLRPNQIFAVSLAFAPPLSLHQQTSIVDTVQRELLTPYGLRTLNVGHANYKGKYSGPQKDRDRAYHQGTVWPWLIGPFVEAYLKVNEFSRVSKKKAAQFIQPLLSHLIEQACLGSVSEIFDGDSPHTPRGCIAQAWSVAELIRAYQLINS